MARTASSLAPSGQRLVSFRHSSAPDPKYTTTEWRRAETKTNSSPNKKEKDDHGKLLVTAFESEDAIEKLTNEEVIKIVKEIASSESPDSCIHGVGPACSECYDMA